MPPKSILVAPQDGKNLEPLLALAEPLAKVTPPREIIMAQVVVPKRFVTGASLDAAEVAATTETLNERRGGADRARHRSPRGRVHDRSCPDRTISGSPPSRRST